MQTGEAWAWWLRHSVVTNLAMMVAREGRFISSLPPPGMRLDQRPGAQYGSERPLLDGVLRDTVGLAGFWVGSLIFHTPVHCQAQLQVPVDSLLVKASGVK